MSQEKQHYDAGQSAAFLRAHRSAVRHPQRAQHTHMYLRYVFLVERSSPGLVVPSIAPQSTYRLIRVAAFTFGPGKLRATPQDYKHGTREAPRPSNFY